MKQRLDKIYSDISFIINVHREVTIGELIRIENPILR